MASQEEFVRRKGLNVRDAIIFVLDWRVRMLEPDERIEIHSDICNRTAASSLLSITLRCIADILKAKIIARSTDIVSVVVFGARGTSTRRSWPGVRVLFPLKQPDADSVKLLQHLAQRLEAGDANQLLDMDADTLQQEPVEANDANFCFGPDVQVQFDKVLWATRHQFTAGSSLRNNVLHRKRVFLFTNDDDPSKASSAIRQLSLTQARDLADIGATLDVSLLISPKDLDQSQVRAGPDSSVFFNDLVYTDQVDTPEENGSVTIATIKSLDELLTRVRQKQMTKRANRKTVLILANDYKIGVTLYSLVKKAVRPTKVELDASTNKPVFKITTNTCEGVGQVLKQEDIRNTFTPEFLRNTRYKVPHAKTELNEEPTQADQLEAPSNPVYGFKKSELSKAKALGTVGIVMYGFRKLSVLKREYTLSSPTFVFPDDTEYNGSTRSFACLLKTMVRRKVVGIASVRLSEKGTRGMRFVALVPQEEHFSESLTMNFPAGLQMYYLPFKDDVYTAWRNEMKEQQKTKMKEEDQLVVKSENMEELELPDDPEGVKVARKMLRKMKLTPYSPHSYLNPDLQRFYAGLENAAGVESRYNPQDDTLDPDTEQLQKRGGDLAAKLKKLEVGDDFDGDALAEQFGTKTGKRSAEQLESAARRKAKKEAVIAEAQEKCDDDDFIRRYHEGTLGDLLKPDLETYCKAHGLNHRGTKANLVILIENDIRDMVAQ